MKATELAEQLNDLDRVMNGVEVCIHDAATGTDIPIERVELPYGGPAKLYPKENT